VEPYLQHHTIAHFVNMLVSLDFRLKDFVPTMDCK